MTESGAEELASDGALQPFREVPLSVAVTKFVGQYETSWHHRWRMRRHPPPN